MIIMYFRDHSVIFDIFTRPAHILQKYNYKFNSQIKYITFSTFCIVLLVKNIIFALRLFNMKNL